MLSTVPTKQHIVMCACCHDYHQYCHHQQFKWNNHQNLTHQIQQTWMTTSTFPFSNFNKFLNYIFYVPTRDIHMIIYYYVYNKIMVPFTVENAMKHVRLSMGWFFSTYPKETFLYSDEGTETIAGTSYIHGTWQKATQISLVLKNITTSRVCPTFRKTSTIEMKIPVAVSLAMWT